MKKILISFLGLSALTFAVISCDDDLPTQANFTAYEYESLDEDGGTWTPVLLTSPDQIVIAAPEATTSSAYQTELAAVKTATASLTGAQQEAVVYWTNNPVLRWNEIALELAAKYNLIPGPNADGTYTLPNAATPDGPPKFPFAHPAYTCRALAYLSVAQYESLIGAWHYKYEFNRPAPYQVDNAIESAYAETALPSYPSDGAAIAAASRDVLSAMFPLEKEFLAAKAEEHFSSLIWAGVNVTSDVEAGKLLGSETVKVVMARAKTDGMSKAQTPKPKSDSIKNAAFERFGWNWENLEVPKRPVGLAPMFGQVRAWSIANIVDVRSVPPPAIGSAEFQAAANELKKHQDDMTPEKRKIANWWSDGLGSYTPPGHWNKFAKDAIIAHKLSPIRSARTLAYMNMAIMDAGIACWDTKYYYHYPRPIQAIPGFKTILGTPNFPAYTSGHSTFSSAAADVLSYIFPDDATQFENWANEAAESRVYAGIHYRFDADAGRVQGKAVAAYTLARLQADGAD